MVILALKKRTLKNDHTEQLKLINKDLKNESNKKKKISKYQHIKTIFRIK